MGIFSNIKNVKGSRQDVYVEPGQYKVKVLVNKQGKTKEGKPFFLSELQILESNNSARPVGSSMTWMVMMDKYPDMALANIKQYASAVGGCSEDEVDEAGIEELTSAANPGAGVVLNLRAVNKKTKKGGDFTKAHFTPAI